MDDSRLRADDRIGRYTVIRQLGAGGMGVVYEARDEDLERAVALKLLPEAFVGHPERRARFLREAKSAAAVSHRNIAMVHEVGEDDGRVFIAMELVRGETLSSRMQRELVSPASALLIALEIARGVAKAHDAGVVHRDLKPSNVMLDEDGGVKILDFGLAKRVGDTAPPDEADETISAITEEGRVLGTPGYMAPEQAEGRPLGPAADVFAIGAILYEMLTGEMAFGGRSTAQRIAATLKDEPAPVSSRVADLPRSYEQLVHTCLEKAPEARPATAGELLQMLEKITEEISSVPRVTVRPPAPSSADAASLVHDETQLAPAPSSRSWWPGIVVAIVIAAGGWWLATRHQSAEPPASTKSLAALVEEPGALSGCPIWTVEGQHGPPGRLGAAAATQACADWGVLIGRQDKRGPAQLLELPVQPVDDFPTHPYAAEDARSRSLAATRDLAVVLDGHIIVNERDFEVSAKLMHGDETRATSTQKNRVLDIAIHRAVRDIAKQVGLDEKKPLPKGLAELFPCKDAGCFLDVTTLDDNVIDGLDIGESCRTLAKEAPVLAGARATECGHAARREDGFPSWPPNLKESIDALPTAGRVFWSGILRIHSLTPAEAKKEAEHVRPLREAAGEDRTFVLYAVVEAVLLFRAGEAEKAAPLLTRAYRLAPTSCDARLMSYELALGGTQRVFLARAAAGWCPSVATAWRIQFTSERGDDRDLELLRTAFYLRAGAMSSGIPLADALMVAGRAQEAKLIASRYLGGDEREQLAGSFLQARIDIFEGRIGSGVDRLDALLMKQKTFGRRDLHNSDWGGLYAALEGGEILGRAEAIADRFLTRYVLSDDFPIVGSGPFGLVYAASFASREIGERSLTKIEQLTAAGKLWKIEGVEKWLRGVRLFHAGDAKAAAEVMRPLVGTPTYRGFLRPEIFDEAEELDLASTLDQKGIEISGELVFMSYAREARRAHARGDTETARRYAKKFVDAWSTADVKVELVTEMRKLAAL